MPAGTLGQKVQTGHLVSSRLELAAQSSREAKPPTSSILEKLTHPQSRENIEREILDKNKIDSSTIFT